jgi:hypothetical protein
MSVELTEWELLDLLAHRMVGAYADPDPFDTDEDIARNKAFNDGVAHAIQFVEAARDDKICPHCGYPQHRDSEGFEGVSLRTFARLVGPKGMRMLR